MYLSLCQSGTAAISAVITQPLLGQENGLLAAGLAHFLFSNSENHPDKNKRKLFSCRV